MRTLTESFNHLKRVAPTIHCITNFVTAGQCANLLLACGASPIMACDENEAAEITGHCQGLCLNMGTFSKAALSAMLLSGEKARAMGIPAVLDPVGVGASTFRRNAALRLIETAKPAVIRGNASEIRALFENTVTAQGVDSLSESIPQIGAEAAALARSTGAVVAMTGETDLVTDGTRFCKIQNGHPLMSRITGAGCQLSSLTAAYCAANPGAYFDAAVCALTAMGVCGEEAARRMGPKDGNASFSNYLTDAMFNLTAGQLERNARYEIH